MSADRQNPLIILEDGEKDLVSFLAKGRFDRARNRNATYRKMGDSNDKYSHDRIGLFAELAFAKKTDVYPSQILSPKCNSKTFGSDLGDTVFKGKRFDVKATVHNNGVLWIDKVNENIDYYAFFVVRENEKVECELVGVIEAGVLHSKKPSHRKQFKFPCIWAEQGELTDWSEFDAQIN